MYDVNDPRYAAWYYQQYAQAQQTERERPKTKFQRWAQTVQILVTAVLAVTFLFWGNS